MPSYTYYIIWVRCDQIWLCFKGLVVEFSRKSLKKYLTTFEAILKNCAYYVKTTVPTFWGFFWKIEHLFNPTSGHSAWVHRSCFRKSVQRERPTFMKSASMMEANGANSSANNDEMHTRGPRHSGNLSRRRRLS